jgi:mono/diheme cytochrome c family protein
MNAPTDKRISTADSIESESGAANLLVGLIVLMALLFYWGAIYFDRNGGWFSPQVYTPYTSVVQLQDYAPRSEGPDIQRGERFFVAACSACHGMDGAGRPGQAPPLAGSEWVNAKGVNRLARIPVLGLEGPIEVKGQVYNFGSPMTAVYPNGNRTSLPDKDLADLLSYVRQAWGNKASEVTEAQVKLIRDEIGSRSKALTVKELLAMPEELPEGK